MARISLKIKPEGRARGEAPSPLDIHVGSRLRQLRALCGLSQEKLGEALGLTFQQVQKYERGQNRIAASRLFDVSRILSVPVSYFFDEYESQSYREPGAGAALRFNDSEKQAGYEAPNSPNADLMTRKETLDLVRAYYKIEDVDIRRKVLELVRSMTPSKPSAKSSEKSAANTDKQAKKTPKK